MKTIRDLAEMVKKREQELTDASNKTRVFVVFTWEFGDIDQVLAGKSHHRLQDDASEAFAVYARAYDRLENNGHGGLFD